jgi:hypothetical protein
MGVMVYCSMPINRASDQLWQQPFNAAALMVPPVLDSWFMLMEKLARSPGASGSGSTSSYSYGSGLSPSERSQLVRALRCDYCHCLEPRLSHANADCRWSGMMLAATSSGALLP